MKVLKDTEMYDAFVKADGENKINKRFVAVGSIVKNGSTLIKRVEVTHYSEDEALIFFDGEHHLFVKSSFDNRFYCDENDRIWALCLDIIESNEVAKNNSETNQDWKILSEKMKFLTENELEPIALYIESCFGKRKEIQKL